MWLRVFVDPAWQTALATWGLVVIAFFAAKWALHTYELESEPVIVLRQLEREEHLPVDTSRLARAFVIDGTPTVSVGLELRVQGPNDVAPGPTTFAVIEFRNVGRSPAIGVRVPFRVSVPVADRESMDETGVDTVIKRGSGEIIIDAIPSQASTYVIVTNLLGTQVTMEAFQSGKQLDISDRKRRKEKDITVVAPSSVRVPSIYDARIGH